MEIVFRIPMAHGNYRYVQFQVAQQHFTGCRLGSDDNVRTDFLHGLFQVLQQEPFREIVVHGPRFLFAERAEKFPFHF